MYDKHALLHYRNLTKSESQMAEKAVLWLANNHLKAKQIAILTDNCLDREGKILYVRIETQHFVWLRKIHYEGSPFEAYITEVLPCLKVKKWLFPNTAWTGRTESFGFHLHVDVVENFLCNHSKWVLIKGKQYDTIKTSTKKANIKTKQIMVGRRLALRA